jgi:hypothetical protein
LSPEVVEFLILAWRQGTRRQYECYLKKWLHKCKIDNVDPVHPSLDYVLQFLLASYKEGLNYSTIGTIRSALSSIITLDGKPVGKHDTVCSFMRAVYQERPSIQRTVTWEVNDVLTFLKTLSPVHSLSLELLTKKTLMMMAILSGQRGQTLHVLRKELMDVSDKEVTFYVREKLKTSKPGRHYPEIKFKSYSVDPDLCVVNCINTYLKRTEQYRCSEESQFFLTYGGSHYECSRASISRWIRDILIGAGIDVCKFSSGTTRAASTSAAKMVCNMDTVLKAGGWSCESTFTKFYNMPIKPKCAFQDGVMERFQKKT